MTPSMPSTPEMTLKAVRRAEEFAMARRHSCRRMRRRTLANGSPTASTRTINKPASLLPAKPKAGRARLEANVMLHATKVIIARDYFLASVAYAR